MRPRPLLVALILGFCAVPALGAPPAATAGAPAAATRAAPGAGTASGRAEESLSLPSSSVPPFAQVDTNHDGVIDWKEAQAVKVPKKVFEHYDFDGNGKLNQTEWLFVRLDMTDFRQATRAPAPATR